MTPWVLTRDTLARESLTGSVLATTVRHGDGTIAVEKGTPLTEAVRDRLAAASWTTLHLVRLDAGDLDEVAAGERLARSAAGRGVTVGRMAGGHWPLRAAARGILEVDQQVLAAINAEDDLSVYTLFDGQVVDAGETVAQAKVIPFVVSGAVVERAAQVVARDGAPVRVRPFVARRVGAVVLAHDGAVARARFAGTMEEKVRWFGGELKGVTHAPDDAVSVREALDALVRCCDIVVVAGSRAMDPLDPALVAADALGGTLVRRGMPAHPGSLLWLSRVGAVWVVGLPSCGVLSQATIFDLVFTWLFADVPITAARLAAVGHGGLLTRDMAYRFPPYRSARERGEVE